MTGIPVWCLGRHLTTANLIPQAVAADGTFTPGSTSSLIGQLDEINVEQSNELENITPMDVRQANYVPVTSESSFTLMEILKANGTNILAAAAESGDYFRLILTRGGQTWDAYVVAESYRESLRRGKNTGQMAVKIVNIGVPNPAYG